MLNRIVLTSVRGFQPVCEGADLSNMVQVFDLDPCHEHTYTREHPARTRDWHESIAGILVVQSELDPGRRDLPEPLVHQTKANYAGVRAEAVARLGEEPDLSRLEHILGTVARGLEVQGLQEPVFSLLPSLS